MQQANMNGTDAAFVGQGHTEGWADKEVARMREQRATLDAESLEDAEVYETPRSYFFLIFLPLCTFC